MTSESVSHGGGKLGGGVGAARGGVASVPADAAEIGDWTEKRRQQLRSKIDKKARKLEKLRKEYNKIPKKKLVIVDVQTNAVAAAQPPSSN